MEIEIKVEESKPENIHEFIQAYWGSDIVVANNRVYKASELEGFSAFAKGYLAGLLSYSVHKNILNIISLNSIRESIGIGSKLIEHTIKFAMENNMKYIRLFTTNDNTNALKFYQKRGFDIKKVRINQIEKSRKIKPQIPLTGFDDIKIKHEIELEYIL
jgi:ribosomal protein S18 acetylase RimI-like enzyme